MKRAKTACHTIGLIIALAMTSGCVPALSSDDAALQLPAVGDVTGGVPNPQVLQTAGTLGADAYTPSRMMPACPASSPLPTTSTPSTLAPALVKAQAYHEETGGLGLMVLKDGQVIHAKFTDGMNADTKTVTASMMKSVTALATGIAIEKGYIGSVDDPVKLYISEWADDPRGDITVKQLLTMSAGLQSVPLMQFLFAPDTNGAAIAAPRAEEPGSEFYYSNSVSQVLGAVLDRQVRAAGYKDYAQFLYRELWCELGNGEALLWTDNQGMPRTYAGLNTGMADWARIGELIRSSGRANGKQIVSSSWIAEMSAPSAANPRYGYQLWRAGAWEAQRRYNKDNPISIPHSAPFAAQDTVFFDGFGGQRVYVIASKGLTIVRVGDVNLQYDDAIIANLITSAIP